MKSNLEKNSILAISLVLVMSLGVLAIPLMPTAKAATTETIPTELFMTASPNPIGAGQPVTATVWLNVAPINSATQYFYWTFTVNVVPPSGSNITLGPFQSASNGGYYTTYTPTQTGNYTFQAFFKQQQVNIPQSNFFYSFPPGTYTYPAAISNPITVAVQSTPIAAWPQTPLPTSYWQTPIFSENQNWYVLAGNWLPGANIPGAFGERGSPQLYSNGPASSHILWTKPITFGGISGGQYGVGNTAPGSSVPYTTSDWGVNYYTGLLYQQKLNPIIISGYLFYNVLPGSSGQTGEACVDLRTGALVWENDSMPQISCGQVLTFQSGVQSGSLAYLWASDSAGWQMFDAFTGRLLTTFPTANLPAVSSAYGFPMPASLSGVYGPDGEILVYLYNSAGNWLALWNSTLAVIGPASEFSAMQYAPLTVENWNQGLQWNVTIPKTVGNPWESFNDYADGVLVAMGETGASGTNPTFEFYGYNDTTGGLIWEENQTNVGWGEGGPGQGTGVYWGGGNTALFGDGVFGYFQRETMQYHVLNVFTGKPIYVTDPLSDYTGTDLSYYDWSDSAQISYGIMTTSGYSGAIVAFNATTGTHLWTFQQVNSGLETPFGTWPSFGGSGITCENGILFFSFTQHSPGTPLFRGYNLYAINYSTGALIWQIPGFFPGSGLALADEELLGYAGYDNQIYAFGQGPSQTTVAVGPKVTTLGDNVVISGTVIDISAGTKQTEQAADFPNGVPCASDASMDAWMSYVYQQQPEPTNFTGVPVVISVLDSNNNCRIIGTVTTDESGTYSLTWTPDIPGNYTVYANFEGTNGYFQSNAETTFNVMNTLTSATPTASPVSGLASNSTLMYGVVVIVIVIIIGIAVVALLTVRKRP